MTLEKHMRQANTKIAIELYHRILETSPEDAISHQELARSLHRTGDLDNSIIECHRALELQGDLSIPHLIFGKILALRGEFDKANSETRSAIDLNPLSVDAYAALAAVLIQERKYLEAIDVCLRAKDIAPAAWLPRHLMALAYFFDGQTEEAIKQERIAFGIKPSLESGWLVSYLYLSRYRLLVGIFLIIVAGIGLLVRNFVRNYGFAALCNWRHIDLPRWSQRASSLPLLDRANLNGFLLLDGHVKGFALNPSARRWSPDPAERDV